MHAQTDIEMLAEDFEKCQKVLTALGDENRQHLILEMMKIRNCFGARVGEITEKTHLSRPAVSHHLQILKDAGKLLLFRSRYQKLRQADSRAAKGKRIHSRIAGSKR